VTLRITEDTVYIPRAGRCQSDPEATEADHSTKQLRQPVMIAGGVPIDVTNAVLQRATIITPPKRADQVRMLAQWQGLAQTMLGIGV